MCAFQSCRYSTMQVAEFDFALPDELIARHPPERRRDSRLLSLTRAGIGHHAFTDIGRFLNAGDVLVLNDTRVIPARLYGHKETGGRVEVLIERLLDEREALCHLRASKAPKPGNRLALDGGYHADVLGRSGDFFHLAFPEADSVLAMAEQVGHMPLPPYIDRPDEADDRERYQTVFARRPGAVAAPTAGLHFDGALLDELRAAGVEIAYLTLHVGAGTFQPVRVETVEEHKMHSEWYEVPAALADQARAARARGNRVVPVGTTALRALESAAASGELEAGRGETDIFIYPGYEFRITDALITNFHLPRSSLLMLVSALAGRERILAAYEEAVRERYRFFSYGDAMYIERGQ